MDCVDAGMVYLLPAKSFQAILQHSAAGSVIGIDNQCAPHARTRIFSTRNTRSNCIACRTARREFLAGIPALASADKDVVGKLAARMKMKSKKAGGVFMHRSSLVADGMYVIRSGTLTLTLPGQRRSTINGACAAPTQRLLCTRSVPIEPLLS